VIAVLPIKKEYLLKKRKIKSDQRPPEPWWADLFTPPIGYRYVTYTYVPTEERVMRGWPPTGSATFLVKKPLPSKSHLQQFDLRGMFDMKRIQLDNQKAKGKWVPSKEPFLSKAPTINQLMTDCFFDDGTLRKLATLKIRVGDESATVTISDENVEASITTTADTVMDALALLEDALANDRVRWRPWPAEFTKGKKKRD